MPGSEKRYAHLEKRNRAEAEKLFLENMNLVPIVIKKMVGKSGATEDALQCGYIGLWKACLYFRENEGAKFTTYASRCICFQYNRDFHYYDKSVKPEKYLSELAYPWNKGCEETLGDVLPDNALESMEQKVAFKDFMERLEPDGREVATALIIGEPLKRIFEEKGVTWWWGTRRKKSIQMKLQEVM